MIPGRKYKHHSSGEVWIYVARLVDGFGEMHELLRVGDPADKPYRKLIPTAHLYKYEPLPEEVNQGELF